MYYYCLCVKDKIVRESATIAAARLVVGVVKPEEIPKECKLTMVLYVPYQG
jgi:hypothetical protein